ncbi:MAG: GNAT family N-acetyltransferase, partial [Planctomycetota bacterium]
MTGADSSDVLVKRAAREQAALVGEILADAFSVDPVGKWISPDPEYPRWCWSLVVPFVLPHDEVYLTGDGQGAAMWVPPGAELDIKLGFAGLWDYWRRFGLRSILRFFRLVIALEKHHPKDPHYYLFAVGVRPGARGQGIGSALLEPVLQECDRRKTGAYVENSNPLNLPFYQRHGFELRSEITLPRNGP